MAYADQTALEDRFGVAELIQIADRDRDGVPDSAVLATIQASTDRLIDGYLATAGYVVPVAAPSAELIACSAALQRYFLFDDARPEAVLADWKYWIGWLERIADRRMMLDLPRAGAATGGSPEHDAPARLFDFTTLASF